jgi:hypothetical protein
MHININSKNWTGDFKELIINIALLKVVITEVLVPG